MNEWGLVLCNQMCFGDGGNVTLRFLPDNLTQWIITQSKDFTRRDIGKISRSIIAYIYLVLTTQV